MKFPPQGAFLTGLQRWHRAPWNIAEANGRQNHARNRFHEFDALCNTFREDKLWVNKETLSPESTFQAGSLPSQEEQYISLDGFETASFAHKDEGPEEAGISKYVLSLLKVLLAYCHCCTSRNRWLRFALAVGIAGLHAYHHLFSLAGIQMKRVTDL